jgi:hypothetical protein
MADNRQLSYVLPVDRSAIRGRAVRFNDQFPFLKRSIDLFERLQEFSNRDETP